MKRCNCMLLFFLLMLSVAMSDAVWATQQIDAGSRQAVIKLSDVECGPEEEIEIPVVIENNPGLMGLGITVVYDAQILTPKSVTAGEVLSHGTVYDSIGGEAEDGRLKIIWSSTESVTTDGVILHIVFQVLAQQETSSEIEIIPTEGDTFDAEFRDIALQCSGGTVKMKEKVISEGEEGNATDPYDRKKNDDMRQVIERVEREQEIVDLEKISVDEKQEYIREIEAQLQEKGVALPPDWKDSDVDQKIKMIQEMKASATDKNPVASQTEDTVQDGDGNQGETLQTGESKLIKGKSNITVYMVVILIIFITAVCLLIQKKKKEDS